MEEFHQWLPHQILLASRQKKEDTQIEKITRDTLKSMKGFQKLLKKQSKENENLKKKQNKEKALMQKQHSSVIDKLAANYDKSVINCVGANTILINNNNSNVMNNNYSNIENNNSINNDANENGYKSKIKEMVEEQSRLWANLIERQQNEEKLLNNEHVEQQCIHFQQLLQEAQKQRKKDIEARQKKETEQLKANQAKQSVEDSKRLLSDKNFRNKQDRDRRLRELNSNNMKRFIDERKRLASKHKQENELIEKMTKEEEDNLNEENKKAKELATCINEELSYAFSRSAVC